MTKISIITFGCSLNRSDSENMAGILKKAQYELVETPEYADLIIINTCTVKDQTIRNFEKTLKQYKDKKIIISGCIAQTKNLPNYSILGTDQIDKIVEVVEQTLEGNIIQLIKKEKNERVNLPKIKRNDTIEIVPICQGCLGLPCSFCQTKQARGNLISYSTKAIVKRIKQAIKEGTTQIWLTAQDTGAYGKDIDTTLPNLLKEILKIQGNYKIRLGMLNPNHLLEFIDELIEIYKDKKMFKFIHIPVQSGNDEILKKMKRQYTIKQFENLIKKLKQIPRITIATDIIVGFPTETEEQFQDTINLVKKNKFDIINISRYSARPNTLAATFEQLNQKIRKERSTELTKVFRKISKENNQKWIGWEGDVLIDDKKQGHNFAYRTIVFENEQKIGKTKKVKIIDTTTFHLKALIQ